MKLNDEILNKYIDGELTPSEMNKVKEILSSSADEMRQYNALLLVHRQLKKIAEENVTVNFTSKVMSEISKKFKIRKSDSYFIFSISSIFVIASLIVAGFALSLIISGGNESTSSMEVLDNLVLFINNLTSSVIKMFSGKGISIFGSIISFAILITGYFFFSHSHIFKANEK